MGQPTFWDNQDAAKATINDLKRLNAIVKPYEEITSSAGDLLTMLELGEEDPSLEAELGSELPQIEERLSSFELQSMLDGPQDSANAFIRIQAGAGGTDACDWAAMLMRMYIRWAERRGFSIEVQDELPNEEAGISNATLKINGEYVYGYLQGEEGVHRLVRISPFGSGDTRQTSFAAVEVTPELDESINIDIKDVDLEMQTFTSGGPGGQHQNKTQSGVRLIHKPTNIRAESRTERSQHKNKANAMALLKARLYKAELDKQMAEVAKRQETKTEVSFGSQIRNYVLQPYTIVKDLRTDTETAQVNRVLDGDIDEFLQAYLRLKAERLNKKK